MTEPGLTSLDIKEVVRLSGLSPKAVDRLLGSVRVTAARGPQAVMDCHHILSDVLSVISTEEKHPLPEEAGGVDYADIYRFLNELLKGDLPKKPNDATCKKLIQMFNEVREAVNAHEAPTKDERTFLERYSFRDLGNLNAPFVDTTPSSRIRYGAVAATQVVPASGSLSPYIDMPSTPLLEKVVSVSSAPPYSACASIA